MTFLKQFMVMGVFFALTGCSEKSVSLDEDKALSTTGSISQPGPVMSSTPIIGISSAIVPLSSASEAGLATFPNPIDSANTRLRFTQWKATFYETREATTQPDYVVFKPGTEASARIMFDTKDHTVSEGIGYGMLIAVFMDDMDMFNRLWTYHKAYRPGTSYLMDWKIRQFSFPVFEGPAPDADLDVATALLVAFKKYPAMVQYRDDALLIANDLWNKVILADPASGQANAGTYLTTVGLWANSQDVFNASYMSPVGYRLFAEFDLNHNWNLVVDATLNYLTMVSNKGNGLIPNWTNYAGDAQDPGNNSSTAAYAAYFGLEAVRVPWRLAWDHLWYGGKDPRSGAILTRHGEFFVNNPNGPMGDVTRVRHYNYKTNEAVMGANRCLQAAACLTGMANAKFQSFLNTCNPVVNAMVIPTGNSYFDPILQVMYSMMLNGKFAKP